MDDFETRRKKFLKENPGHPLIKTLKEHRKKGEKMLKEAEDKKKRREGMLLLRKKGWTTEKIGKKYNLTHQMVSLILNSGGRY